MGVAPLIGLDAAGGIGINFLKTAGDKMKARQNQEANERLHDNHKHSTTGTLPNEALGRKKAAAEQKSAERARQIH